MTISKDQSMKFYLHLLLGKIQIKIMTITLTVFRLGAKCHNTYQKMF